ncbi:hypothetical protein [Mycobacterium sp. E802]|uniref:hypothetical protein n=1 Tax=Mycobacterium sp. E802 TaxID=1834152 RepID=UPI000A8DCCB5|nr:hypothetical protein [Mycobacterium sp. E802]
MTGIGTEDVPGHWLTAAEIAQASQLREDLVARFLPTMQPPENLYSRDLVSVARFVKALTDLGTPTAAVEVAVAELRARPDAAFHVALGSGSRWPSGACLATGRSRTWKAVGAATAAVLIVGGVLAVTLPNNEEGQAASAPTSPPSTKTIPAEPVSSAASDQAGARPAQAFAAAKPDPICVQWQRASAGFDGRQRAWAKTDHGVPAARWTPKQRSITMAVVPVMREEAAELRRLSDKATDPLLVNLLRAQSKYVDNYAAKLSTFQPADQAHWTAATAMDGAVKAVCATPR